jgi:signal transduction histidine kinase
MLKFFINQLKQTVDSHPFPVLLYIEWVMLAIVSMEWIFPPPLYPIPSTPLVGGITQVLYALIGLRLPKQNPIHKLIYVGLLTSLCVLILLEKGRMFPLIVVIFLIRSCLILNFRGRLIALLGSIAFNLIGIQIRFDSLNSRPELRQISQPFQTIISLVACIGLVFVLVAIEALFAERRGKDKLAIANQQLREYAVKIEEQATLQERNRIAREIHDSLGHSLTALNLQIEATLRLWQIDTNRAEEFLKQAKHLGSQALAEVRASVSTMRVDFLAEQNLIDILTDLLLEFQNNTGIKPQQDFHFSAEIVPKQMNRIIYRIVQEALTNISKHAFYDSFSLSPTVQISLISNTTGLQQFQIQNRNKGYLKSTRISKHRSIAQHKVD